MRKGERTRERILEVAEAAILQKGFGGTSIDELVAEVNITKGGFLYHFQDKNQLALALLQRFIQHDTAIYDGIVERAAELSDDPLQRLLIGLRLYAELVENLPEGHPGCLVATICYQERLFDAEIRALNREAVLTWRKRFRATFEEIMERYEPVEPVDLDALADMVSTVMEGGIVMARALEDPRVLPQQVLELRTYIKLLFRPKQTV